MDHRTAPSVELVIPSSPRYLRLARLTAAGLAGDLGFGVEAIEDLRVSIDELCAALIDGLDDTAALALTYREVDGSLEVEGRCPANGAGRPELDAVATELLAILADSYALDVDGDDRTFRLRKQSGS